MISLLLAAALLAAPLDSASASSQTGSTPETYLKARRLLDGKHAIRENVIVVVRDGKILRIDNSAPQSGEKVIDLGERTLMPGLIDAHTHIALHAGDYDGQILRETPEYRALWASANAKKTLESGVTTIRDLGNEGSGFADIALRDAIENGLVPGPRIVAAIRPVTATGAYRLVGYSPYLQTPALSSAADGVGEVRKEVRLLIAQGADVIKIYMESFEKKQLRDDILTGSMNYSREELNALIEEAHRAHLRVAAHTYSDEAAKIAIEVGVDSIEHGLYLSDATFKTMATKGIYYVPTLMVYEMWRDNEIFQPVSDMKRQQLANTVREHIASYQRALKSGVRIAFGTDTFEKPGSNAHEIELMVRYGMTPMEALKAATTVSAELLGIAESTGSIEAGKAADIIAVDGNPLDDIGAIRHVAFVMKGGAVFVAPEGAH